MYGARTEQVVLCISYGNVWVMYGGQGRNRWTSAYHMVMYGARTEQVVLCISYGNVWGKDRTGGPVHIIR